jgi:hypothetical protein
MHLIPTTSADARLARVFDLNRHDIFRFDHRSADVRRSAASLIPRMSHTSGFGNRSRHLRGGS